MHDSNLDGVYNQNLCELLKHYFGTSFSLTAVKHTDTKICCYCRCGCLWCNSVSCCDHRKEIVQKCETVQPISGKGFELGEKEKEYENELMENPPPDVDTKQRSRV